MLPDDVRDLAPDVMAHRLVLSFDALADGVTAREIVNRVLAAVPLPVIAPQQEGRRQEIVA
jgi:MoxR-like ATPase